MKKLTSILLSAIIMLTAVVGFDLTAYAGAGSYDTTAKAKSYTLGTTTTGYFSSNDNTDFLKVEHFFCKDYANERNVSLLTNCRAPLIFCKDYASECNESLLSDCRAPLIFCKDTLFF